MAEGRMKRLFLAVILLIVTCIPKPFAVPQQGETIKIHFKKIEGRYGQLVDKTQFYVFRDSKGWVVPVEDSVAAEYCVQFSINSSLMRLKNPEDKIYEVIAKIKNKGSSSFIGMTEASDKGKWDEVVTPLAEELTNNIVPIFDNIRKEREKEKTQEREQEQEKKPQNE
jgi:hypothetical protein